MSDVTPSTPAAPAPAAPSAPTQPVSPVPAPAATPTAGTPAPAASSAPPPAAPTPEPVYTLTLPDGSPLEASAVQRVTDFAKSGKLAPETAQQVLDLAHAESHALVQRQVAEYQQKVTGWESSVKADANLGGANYPRTQTRVKLVMDKFSDPELKEAFQKTGFGNYPALVRCFEKIGAMMEGDQVIPPGATAPDEKNVLDRMFPTSAGK